MPLLQTYLNFIFISFFVYTRDMCDDRKNIRDRCNKREFGKHAELVDPFPFVVSTIWNTHAPRITTASTPSLVPKRIHHRWPPLPLTTSSGQRPWYVANLFVHLLTYELDALYSHCNPIACVCWATSQYLYKFKLWVVDSSGAFIFPVKISVGRLTNLHYN